MPDCVIFGEIGLSGEVRRVANPEGRLKEAAKLGFKHAALPPPQKGAKRSPLPLDTVEIGHAKELVSWLSTPYVQREALGATGRHA